MTEKEADLIAKLVELANNNPNENEANAAARKVCVLLKDAFTRPHRQESPRVYRKWEGPIYNPTGRTPPGSNRAAKQGPAETEPPKPHVDSPINPFRDYGIGGFNFTGFKPTDFQYEFWRNFTGMSEKDFKEFVKSKQKK